MEQEDDIKRVCCVTEESGTTAEVSLNGSGGGGREKLARANDALAEATLGTQTTTEKGPSGSQSARK